MIAIIDLGSNLTKLVIAQPTPSLQIIHRSVYNTKTLKNAPKGYFDEAAIHKITADLTKVVNVCKQHQCTTILGIATSAFRTRKNGQNIINEINTLLGTQIKIISGEQEASLIFKGALWHQYLNPSTTCMVMDIGGGSTEFIIGNTNQILWKHSFEIGSTALTQGVLVSNPLSADNISELRHRLQQILPQLWQAINQHKPSHLIGTTGAFESLALIIEGQRVSPDIPRSGYEFNLNEVTAVLKQLITSTPAQRKNIRGIHPMREDTIAIAALILQHVINNTHFDHFTLSLEDVKEGLILNYLNL